MVGVQASGRGDESSVTGDRLLLRGPPPPAPSQPHAGPRRADDGSRLAGVIWC